MAMPALVNVVVTSAIIARIICTRRRVCKLVGKVPWDSAYLGLTATLVESSLPPAVLGVVAAVLHRAGGGHGEARVRAFPTMLWVAITVRDFV